MAFNAGDDLRSVFTPTLIFIGDYDNVTVGKVRGELVTPLECAEWIASGDVVKLDGGFYVFLTF